MVSTGSPSVETASVASTSATAYTNGTTRGLAISAIGTNANVSFRNFAVVAKPILEHRINASIQDIASILASAWEKAGKPDLPLNPPHFIRKIRNGGGSTQESTIKQ